MEPILVHTLDTQYKRTTVKYTNFPWHKNLVSGVLESNSIIHLVIQFKMQRSSTNDYTIQS